MGPGGPGGPPQRPPPSPEQIAAMKKAEEMKDKWMAMEYSTEDMKGKVDISWFGHGGFKIHFKDEEGEVRNIYVDIWIDNVDCPKDLKEQPPNDADLVLISRG